MSILSTTGEADISCGRFTYWIMAQTNSGGQGTNGVADESPNMIVYRKVRQLLFLAGTCVCVESLRVCNSPGISHLMMSRAMEIAHTDGKTGLWLMICRCSSLMRVRRGHGIFFSFFWLVLTWCARCVGVRHTYAHRHLKDQILVATYWRIDF